MILQDSSKSHCSAGDTIFFFIIIIKGWQSVCTRMGLDEHNRLKYITGALAAMTLSHTRC